MSLPLRDVTAHEAVQATWAPWRSLGVATAAPRGLRTLRGKISKPKSHRQPRARLSSAATLSSMRPIARGVTGNVVTRPPCLRAEYHGKESPLPPPRGCPLGTLGPCPPAAPAPWLRAVSHGRRSPLRRHWPLARGHDGVAGPSAPPRAGKCSPEAVALCARPRRPDSIPQQAPRARRRGGGCARLKPSERQRGAGAARQQRLSTTNISSKVDLLLDRINTENVAFDESLAGSRQLCPTCPSLPHCKMATEELSAISSQLLSQSKVIESLTQSVNRLKQEKELQQQRIHNLEEEVSQLQNSPHSGLESLLGRRMEGLKSELRNLRQQVFHQPDGDCTPDLYPSTSVMQEMHESKRLLWREYECVRREVEQLKHKLNRQGEDLFNQMSETDEMKRTQSRYCKMLEDLMNSHKAQSDDLDKTRLEARSTQQELGRIKSTVTDLKDQMKNLPLEKPYTKPIGKESAHGKEGSDLLREEETLSSSLCEESASELSLTDVSSDELSSATESKELEGSKDISSLELEENSTREEAGSISEEEKDLSSDLSDSLPELNLSDL